MSVATLRKDGTDFEGRAAVCRGAPKKHFLKLILPMFYDQRDFVTFSEVSTLACAVVMLVWVPTFHYCFIDLLTVFLFWILFFLLLLPKDFTICCDSRWSLLHLFGIHGSVTPLRLFAGRCIARNRRSRPPGQMVVHCESRRQYQQVQTEFGDGLASK